jgi:NADPH-dependent glutamate synthase beta subunit-like oxidoreductase
MLDLPGAKLTGVQGGLDFLRDFNAGATIAPMGRVVVIGGGNVAYDCARSALRAPGTTSVTLASLEALYEMPADQVEILEGEEEGIIRRNRLGPVRFVEGTQGRLGGVEFRAVARVFDENKRFAPELTPNTEEIIPCDTVLLAVGQAGDTGFVTGMSNLELGRGGTVIADRNTGRTSIPWLFSAGDASLGPGLFIDAIAHARRAAESIHAYLGGEPAPANDDRAFAVEASRQSLRREWLTLTRSEPPSAAATAYKVSQSESVELSFPEKVAQDQGARCLRCEVETVFDGALCIQCGGCADVCPTWCLRLVRLDEIGVALPGGDRMSAIIKDEERCVRCALCADRCPTGAISMERLCGFEPWATLPGVGTAA